MEGIRAFDSQTIAGLPGPIHEGLSILKKHMYVSLTEIQIKEEEEAMNRPFTMGKVDVPLNRVEQLYEAMLPNLPQYVIAILKVLLAAAPTAKPKTESINILADVFPEDMPSTVLLSMRLGIDVNRHKEIIVKAISAFLFLLLKHFKLSHVYEFEYISQHLVFANCIPLILKYLNQNISAFVAAKNTIPQLDFPACILGDPLELTAESLENADQEACCWRNLFSCINLVRILQNSQNGNTREQWFSFCCPVIQFETEFSVVLLTAQTASWRTRYFTLGRFSMLVVFKSAPILKRVLKVKHELLQLYVLKLLKAQTKYLGRNWRKSNMKTMSAIYQKVRHRLNDDWAYGNDLDARPWDFQGEENALRTWVDRFNNRRYGIENCDRLAGENSEEDEYYPVNNDVLSVLGEKIELSSEFKSNYERWLDREVFSVSIDWDQLCTCATDVDME
ncbi:Striatin-interacting protein 2 [Desmophyllum pertusum]|uniref:Striatin-interacting protein 2 n=1 Tax=Desmophyllum pertusum TaxID=174260 RepID=A0A9W9ZC62_9CNID|nr:Striatin-interacting protein 2 [Desmophyllum pertusum]